MKKPPSVKGVSIRSTSVSAPAFSIEKIQAVVPPEFLSIAVMESSAPKIPPVKVIPELPK